VRYWIFFLKICGSKHKESIAQNDATLQNFIDKYTID
jgi:hypothetical protein